MVDGIPEMQRFIRTRLNSEAGHGFADHIDEYIALGVLSQLFCLRCEGSGPLWDLLGDNEHVE